MTPEQRGAYVHLLCHNWIEESLPADLELLARLADVPYRRFVKLWPAIEPCFRVQRNGRLCNNRMRHEIVKYKRRVAVGRKSAQKRWSQNVSGSPNGSPNGNPMLANPPTPQPPNPPNKKEMYDPLFEGAWAASWRRGAKRTAGRAWSARLREGVDPTDLTRAIELRTRQYERDGTEDRYRQHVSTFLGPDEHWKDQLRLEAAPKRTCNECGKRFPESQMVELDDWWICKGCDGKKA